MEQCILQKSKNFPFLNLECIMDEEKITKETQSSSESLFNSNNELAKHNTHLQTQLKRYLAINNILMSQSFALNSQMARLTKQNGKLKGMNAKMKSLLEKINEETFQLFREIYVDSNEKQIEEEESSNQISVKPYIMLKDEFENVSITTVNHQRYLFLQECTNNV